VEGKERDIKLAIQLRDSFIKQYNDNKAFDRLLSELQESHSDRLIHSLKKEMKINIIRYYKDLKQVLSAIIQNNARDIFICICKIDDSRVWINDNGKHINLAFEAVYSFYKKNQEVLKYLDK